MNTAHKKSVLITGGGSGLGHALAQQYLQLGWDVTVLDLRITNPVEGASVIQTNLASFDPSLVDKLPIFDLIICNAGISLSGNFVEHDKQSSERLFAVNTFGHMELIRLLLAKQKIKQKGSIGLVCSASVFLPWPVAVGYAASKAALDGFGHALESYLVGKQITVSRIYPGPMKTPHAKYYAQIDEGKGADPNLVARSIVRGLRKRKRKIYPDKLSKLFVLASTIFPKTVAKKIYHKYNHLF